MKRVFADTNYWIAITNRQDNLHLAAMTARKNIGQSIIITTDEVMVEYLNFFSKHGSMIRTTTLTLIQKIRKDPNTRVLPQTRDSFDSGMELFEARKDKQYSLTDCISMQLMWRDKIEDILTDDHHFAQEGFKLLIK